MFKINIKNSRYRNLMIASTAVVMAVGVHVSLINAQSLQDIQAEIERLNSEISSSEERISELREREDTLENRVELLEAEIEQARSAIATTEREITQTQHAIEEKERELERTRELIQENVRVLYKHGDPSTLEILFASENFTDFVNRQEYLDRVKSSLNEAARESVEIKLQLEEEETELQALREEQEAQEQRIAANIEEQERLLEETRGEEERYQELVEQQREQLQEAEREQASIIAAARISNGADIEPGSIGNGGYPDQWAPPVPINSKVDNWGFYSRQCTSYAAWKRYDLGRPIGNWGFQGIAHARFWTNSGYYDGQWVEGRYAQRDGFEVNNTPAQGAVAVLNSGQFGHVAIVEEVFNGGASFRVSEYNADFNGYYADYNIYSNSSAWSFIHD